MPADEVLITKVAPRAVEVQRDEHLTSFSREQVQPIQIPEDRSQFELSLWDKIRLGPLLFPSVFIIIEGLVMKDLKTTISGIVRAIFIILSVLGIGTGHVTEGLVSACLAGIADVYQAFWMPDKKD